MGLFDKKSSSTTNVHETTVSENYVAPDNRVGGAGSIMGGNINARTVGNVTMTDHGAIAEATGITRDAIDFAANQGANAFQFADNAMNYQTVQALGAQDVLRESNRNISSLASQAFTDLTGLSSTISKDSYGFARGIASDATGALSNAVNQISGVVKRANESDSVEIYRVVALGAAALFGLYLIFGKK